LVASAFVGGGEAVAQEQASKGHDAENSTESKQSEPVSSEFGTHVVKVNTVVSGFWRADVSVASEERTGAHGCRGVIAFREGEVELIPAIFDTGDLVAVDGVAGNPEVDRACTCFGRGGPLDNPSPVSVRRGGFGVGQALFVKLPVLSLIAGKRTKRDSHGEAARVGSRCRWAADKLEVEGVGFASNPSERNIVENHLDAVVGDLVVAKATGFCNIVDVNLAGRTLVRLFPTNPAVVRGSEGWEQQQHPCEGEQRNAGRRSRFVHSLTLTPFPTWKDSLNIVSKTPQKVRRSVAFFEIFSRAKVSMLQCGELQREGFMQAMRLAGVSAMTNHPFENTYNLSDEQLSSLDEAEDLMLKGALGAAEKLLLSMLETDKECIPVLSNLGHLYGRHLSEFEAAVEYYDRVLALEPDNAWARDARRRYLRYIE